MIQLQERPSLSTANIDVFLLDLIFKGSLDDFDQFWRLDIYIYFYRDYIMK